jgi:hypothetical protein
VIGPSNALSGALSGELVRRAPARAWAAPVGEFLLVGGLTPLLFALSWLLRRTLGLDAAEYAVGFTFFYAAVVINDPHFAVTYLLFYRDARARAFGAAFDPKQRARYVVAGAVVRLVLAAWAAFALATGSAAALGLMIQLMFFLVGWHYVKQGFGVMTVLAARRGVRFSPRERLVILAHCFAGWAYAWASPFDPGREVEEKGVVYTTLAHPPGLERVTQIAFFLTVVPLVWVLVQKARRERRWPSIAPLTALFASVWSWSIYSSVDPLVRYAIPALHSVQYLFMVWLLERGAAREREGPPWFETSASARLGLLAASTLALGWLLFHGAPSLLDDLASAHGARMAHAKHAPPSALGATPYFAALYAFVNIHHYFMDNVIWRRENPHTRHLRRPPESAESSR